MGAWKHKVVLAFAAVTTLHGLTPEAGFAQAPPPPPPESFTMWKFLGIPQAINKVKDATINTRGNHPGMERKPPMKRLADPANLYSNNPAIKAAAQIKAEEDLAQQKIKALKYLATIGCGCYDKKIDPPVKVALMAALDDCTEQVRYEAAKAIGEAACTKCKHCSQNCCCDEAMGKKLSEVAYEKDDNGCWLESSARVRAAAKEALRACCKGNRPPPGFIPQEIFEQIYPPGTTPERPETVPQITPPETVPTAPRPAAPGSLPVLPVPPEPTAVPVPVKPAAPTAPAPQKQAEVEPATEAQIPASFAVLSEPSSVALGNSLSTEVAGSSVSYQRKPVLPQQTWISDDGPVRGSAAMKPLPVAPAEEFESQPEVEAPAQMVAPAYYQGMLRGVITSVDVSRRTVRLAFPKGDSPFVGAHLNVTHEFVLGAENLGALRVISVSGRQAVAVPVGNADFAHMGRDDKVAANYNADQRLAMEGGQPTAADDSHLPLPPLPTPIRPASHLLRAPE